MKHTHLFISVVILLNSFSVLAQKLGSYNHEVGLEVSVITLTDSGFIKSSGHSLDHGSFLTKGHFKVSGDTLVLIGVPWLGEDSFYQVLTKKDSATPLGTQSHKNYTELLLLEFEFVDEDLKPSSLPIVFYNKRDKPIFMTFVDTTGKFNLSTENRKFKSMKVGGLMSFRPLLIDLDQFRGNSTTIKAIMKYYDWNTYDKKHSEEMYLIDKEKQTLQYINKRGKLGMQYKYREN